MRRVCAVRTHAVFKKYSFQSNQRPLKAFPSFQTAFFIFISLFIFLTVQSVHRPSRDKPVCFGVGVVGEGGEAVAGGFGEADVAGDDGIEEQVAEVLFELFADFDDEAAAAVVHGADDAGYVEVGVDGLADFADGCH